MDKLMNEYFDQFLEQFGTSAEENFKKEVVKDFWCCLVSREVSIIGRKEVLTGKAKFGILGDGKEVPQVAMARFFKDGDFRSGYYRDQTFMFSAGLSSVEDFFAQLYADVENDPFSGGRQMNAHFATRMVDAEGNWLNLTERKNITPDISPTAGQMARGLGVALASKLYRKMDDFAGKDHLSNNGDEISFITIGDASTSEGAFWETLNAAAVNRVPMCVIVWDDGYGISVPTELQTIKRSISAALEGFVSEDEDDNGIVIESVKAHDYVGLCDTFEKVTEEIRKTHRPVLIHVEEVTQPQGHSTSGSHERYKSEERLNWEREHDCNEKMKQWMIENKFITSEQAEELEEKAIKFARQGKKNAWKKYMDQVNAFKKDTLAVLSHVKDDNVQEFIQEAVQEINTLLSPSISEILDITRKLNQKIRHQYGVRNEELDSFVATSIAHGVESYATDLYSHSPKAAIKAPIIYPEFSEDSPTLNGYQVLNKFFDEKLKLVPELVAFGEDVGQIGDVNQGFAGLQEKHGVHKVFDTGIREWSIMGMAIGSAMRGIRPIAEIQYLDYLLYGLAPLSDDLATLRYRSKGLCQSPAIIRTRGHRLEGIWHAGSPMGMMLNALKGIYILVPRNMTKAAGFYNTLLQSDDPAIVVECLNGYRLKEKMPDNIQEYTVPLGVPEIMEEGSDVTLVTYGSCIREAEKAVERLKEVGISVELIDVQSLMPFDLEGIIGNSLKKTNRIVFMDEDVPGGGTAYMMQKVLEEQGGYKYLDSSPVTIAAAEHRPPYGSEGDYFAKPNASDVYDVIYKMMMEYDPQTFA